LDVYDLTGCLVAPLTNGWLPVGVHQVYFNASELASGIYLARLQAGDYSQTRKLLLIK
jgi:hypothetical protein